MVIHLTLPGGAFDASGDTSTASWHGALAVSRGTGRFDGVGGTGMLRQFFDHSTSAFRLRLPTPS